MSELLSELHGVGLPMGVRYAPTSFTDPETKEDHISVLYVGYTTDQAKAERAAEMGVTVTSLGGSFPSWEITVRVIDP